MGNWNKDFYSILILSIFIMLYILIPHILIGFLLCGLAIFLIYSKFND